MYYAKQPYRVPTSSDHQDLSIHLSGEDSPSQVELFAEGTEVYEKIWESIGHLINNTISPLSALAACPNASFCFKLFGLDILVDNAYKVYLAEINARLISIKYPCVQMYFIYKPTTIGLFQPFIFISRNNTK